MFFTQFQSFGSLFVCTARKINPPADWNQLVGCQTSGKLTKKIALSHILWNLECLFMFCISVGLASSIRRSAQFISFRFLASDILCILLGSRFVIYNIQIIFQIILILIVIAMHFEIGDRPISSVERNEQNKKY